MKNTSGWFRRDIFHFGSLMIVFVLDDMYPQTSRVGGLGNRLSCDCLSNVLALIFRLTHCIFGSNGSRNINNEEIFLAN